MTNEEKKAQMDARNTAICKRYEEGARLATISSEFKLGRQRVQQILQAGNVWRPYERSDRTKHLGVTISEETKTKLKAMAKGEGVSVSQFTSNMLDELVAEAK